MKVQLTQEERKTLEDQKRHEEVCIQKYDEYSQRASDPQLREMFAQFASQERQHYDSLEQLLQGRQPMGGGTAGQQRNTGSMQAGQQTQGRSAGQNEDGVMCRDALMMERFISDSYDTGIFGTTNTAVRQALQHIQDEEQQHGEGILNYLQDHGLQS